MMRVAWTARKAAPFIAGVGLAIATAVSLASAAGPDAQGISGEELPVEAIREIVRDYIIENPEVVRDALQGLRKKERAESRERTKRAIAQRRDELFNDPDSPVGGNPEGDVTVVEFFDYNCPYCRRVAPTIAQILEQDPNVRIVYKEYPILGSGSVLAAQAALAAKAQAKYHAFHAALTGP